jgi:hypothetical protein
MDATTMTVAATSPPSSAPTPWITRLFDRFWGLFLVSRTYSLGVDYKPLAEKGSIRVAVEVQYRRYLWDWGFGSRPVVATTAWGSMQMAGDPVAVAIVAEVKALSNRFLRSEIPRMETVLGRNLTDRLSWIGVRVTSVTARQYATAAVEEKKK